MCSIKRVLLHAIKGYFDASVFLYSVFIFIYFLNTLRPRQDGRHFPDDIFKCNFLTENVWISIKISLKFVPNGPINIIPSLVQIMAWRRLGDKPLSEPMMVSLSTHICITRPQWVKHCFVFICMINFSALCSYRHFRHTASCEKRLSFDNVICRNFSALYLRVSCQNEWRRTSCMIKQVMI